MNKSYRIDPNFTHTIPPGDNLERSVCTECGFIDYNNPKIVVGAVALWDQKILLCSRSIDPRRGFWTLPAGYLENGESAEDGARREAREEACAEIEIDRLLAVYSIPRISQIQLMYRARLTSPGVMAGEESLEVGLFEWADIPWADLAFLSVGWALRQYHETARLSDFPPFTNPADGL
jgi:ADP-ribose pyrophosphatase YjhB (NUDIX family)